MRGARNGSGGGEVGQPKQPKPPKEPMPPVPVARGTVLWAKMQGYPYWPAIVETEKVPNRQMRVAGTRPAQ